MILDREANILKNGDVIDIGQTVNGFSKFFIKSLIPIDVRYDYNRDIKYEYDMSDLLAPSNLTGESEFIILSDYEQNS